MKGYFKYFGLWLTLGINLFLLGEYLFNSGNAKNVVFIFWIQSIVLGMQNVFLILFSKSGFSINNTPGDEKKSVWISNLFTAGFFTFHYGIFIVGFGAVAIFSNHIPGRLFQGNWVFPTMVLIAVGALLELPQKILGVRMLETSVAKLMFVPYIRLIPFVIVMMGEPKIREFWVFPLFLTLKFIVDWVYYRYMDFYKPYEV